MDSADYLVFGLHCSLPPPGEGHSSLELHPESETRSIIATLLIDRRTNFSRTSISVSKMDEFASARPKRYLRAGVSVSSPPADR